MMPISGKMAGGASLGLINIFVDFVGYAVEIAFLLVFVYLILNHGPLRACLFGTELVIQGVYLFQRNVIGILLAGGGIFALYYLLRYFCVAGGVCQSKALLTGKTVILTGGNGCMGRLIAVDLGRRGAKVILVDVQGGEDAVSYVRRASRNNNVVFYYVDLASLASVRQCAAKILQEEPQIDILINSAGIGNCPYRKTEDGFELQFGVNHLGHFLLTNLLLERLKEAPAARIVNVSSWLHVDGRINFDDLNLERSYNRLEAYARSKLANVLFTRHLARKLEGTRVTVNALNPGSVNTPFTSKALEPFPMPARLFAKTVALLFFKTPWEGAQTTIYCAVSEEMEGVTGQYLADCRIKKPSKVALDDEVARRLWEVSVQMVGLDSE